MPKAKTSTEKALSLISKASDAIDGTGDFLISAIESPGEETFRVVVNMDIHAALKDPDKLPSDVVIEWLFCLYSTSEDEEDMDTLFSLVMIMVKHGIPPTEVMSAALQRSLVSKHIVDLAEAILKFRNLCDDWPSLFRSWLEESGMPNFVKDKVTGTDAAIRDFADIVYSIQERADSIVKSESIH